MGAENEIRVMGIAARLEELGALGLTVSVCYGPIRGGPPAWSVLVGGPAAGLEFDRPYAARSLEDAVWIAAIESGRRGWIPERAAARVALGLEV